VSGRFRTSYPADGDGRWPAFSWSWTMARPRSRACVRPDRGDWSWRDAIRHPHRSAARSPRSSGCSAAATTTRDPRSRAGCVPIRSRTGRLSVVGFATWTITRPSRRGDPDPSGQLAERRFGGSSKACSLAGDRPAGIAAALTKAETMAGLEIGPWVPEPGAGCSLPHACWRRTRKHLSSARPIGRQACGESWMGSGPIWNSLARRASRGGRGGGGGSFGGGVGGGERSMRVDRLRCRR